MFNQKYNVHHVQILSPVVYVKCDIRIRTNRTLRPLNVQQTV